LHNVCAQEVERIHSPGGVLAMVNQLATKQHKTLHHAQTDETMVMLAFNTRFGSF
jgi:hypothetical protein